MRVFPPSKVAQQRFQAIGEAYAILSDPQKKARYDRGPPEPVCLPVGAGAGSSWCWCFDSTIRRSSCQFGVGSTTVYSGGQMIGCAAAGTPIDRLDQPDSGFGGGFGGSPFGGGGRQRYQQSGGFGGW